MARRLPLALGCALALSLCTAANVDAAVAARPWIVSGTLGPKLAGPVDDAAAIATARSAIATQFPWSAALRLDLERVDRRPDGSRVIRFSQTVSGIAVVDHGARALVEADGTVTIASAMLDDRPPVTTTFSIDATTAAATAARRTGFAFDPARARLVLVSRPDGLHTTWRLHGTVSFELPMRPLAHVDATTGALTLMVDKTRRAKQLRAWPQNPFKTPTLGTFTLAALADGATTLDTTTVVARSCIDKSTVKKISAYDIPRDMHVCDVVSAAVADSSGDFLYSRPPKDTAIDDPLSETSLAYHTDKGLRFFADLGLTTLRKEASPIHVIANIRFPPGFNSPSPSSLACATCALEPLDNAFFAPAGESDGELFGEKGDALYFGQGTKFDYAYDGDVVYHELTHGVVESTAKLVQKLHVDAQGAVDAAPAMNEALADYFSSALTGDGDVGEYASGGAGIRSLTDFETCPDRLVNEPHIDSVPFSGALWSVRTSLDSATQKSFDRGVLLALQVLPSGDVGFEELASAIVTGVTKEAGAGPAKDLTAAFAKRGLSPCTRVHDVGLGAKSPWSAYLSYGATSADATFADSVVPGMLQFKKTLPAGTTSILVSFEGRDLPSSPRWIAKPAWSPVLLVKFGGPIVWKQTGTTWTADYSTSRALTPGDEFWNESFPVPPGSTEVHLVIGAKGDGDGYYDNITIEPTVKPVTPDAGPLDSGKPDARPDTGAIADAGTDASSGDADVELDPVNGRACGCATIGRTSDRGAWIFVAFALLAAKGRRRHHA